MLRFPTVKLNVKIHISVYNIATISDLNRVQCATCRNSVWKRAHTPTHTHRVPPDGLMDGTRGISSSTYCYYDLHNNLIARDTSE